jgi:DNA mismatch endonuclease, patch repair protein
MRNQKRLNTKPEIALRKELWRLGMRYRLNYRLPISGLRRSADVAFVGARVAVFVDGCFWHSCPLHGTRPKLNSSWWSTKLDKNIQRDRETDDLLEQIGWISERVWEHEDAVPAALRIAHTVERRRGRSSS